MKLVVTGASGFAAQEIIRQSLSIPEITSVIALARRQISPPSNLGKGADTSKLESVLIKDYGTYSDEIKSRLTDADACIWTVAVLPGDSRGMDLEKMRHVCKNYPLAGLEAMINARVESNHKNISPLRFMYMSGAAAERDQTKPPRFMAQYRLIRGETENALFAFAADHKADVELSAARPGLILTPRQTFKAVFLTLLKYTVGLPSLYVGEVAAALLHEVVHGFEKESLENDDLVRIGKQALTQGE